MRKFVVENREPLLIVAKIPVANLAHAVQLGKLIEDKYHGIACVVEALYGRTLIGQDELASFEVKNAIRARNQSQTIDPPSTRT